MVALLTTLSMAASLAAQSPQPSPAYARVTGRIVAAASSTPIEGAQVMLVPIRRANPTGATPAFPPGMPPQRTTDADGTFAFERIIPGEYRLNVTKAGFVSDMPMLGAAAARPPLQLAAGAVVNIGDIALSRGGVIAGRVLDPSGEPVANARVSALRRLPNASPEMGLMPLGTPAQTNDLGEFRVFFLPTGDYAIAATQMTAAGTSMPKTVLTTTFFPSTTNDADATMIAVSAPNTVNGIELRLASVPAFRVSGVVVDESGAPVANAMVMLLPSGRRPMFGSPTGNVRTGPNGGFVLGGVPPGTYRAQASPMITSANGGGATFSFNSGPGGAPGADIVVTDADVGGVRVVIQAR